MYPAPHSARVIVERLHGHWSAWFADTPECAYGGDWPAEAIEALLSAHPERGALSDQISGLDDAVQDDHLEFVIKLATELCPDCGGSGRYVGLKAVEPCRACHGSGRRRVIPF